MTSEEKAAALRVIGWPDWLPFKFGDYVFKRRGASWNGRVCGWYTTELTPIGLAVESRYEHGSVQIYPASALMLTELP